MIVPPRPNRGTPRSLLKFATFQGFTVAMELLISHGAEVDARPDGSAALHVAADAGLAAAARAACPRRRPRGESKQATEAALPQHTAPLVRTGCARQRSHPHPPSPPEIRDDAGNTPLLIAATEGEGGMALR